MHMDPSYLTVTLCWCTRVVAMSGVRREDATLCTIQVH